MSAVLDAVRTLDPASRLLYWIGERERIRVKREGGEPWPWTVDPILSGYRFCNIRRMDDAVSRWLMDNWYGPFRNHTSMLYAAALARFINLPSSLKPITPLVFGGDEPDWDGIKRALREVQREVGVTFNGAYMVRGNTKESEDKVATVVDEYVKPLSVYPPHVDQSSLQRTHAALGEHYGFGSFMAGQVVADLRWAVSGEWSDRMTWAPRGPGSTRGLNRFLGNRASETMTDATFYSVFRDFLSFCRAEVEHVTDLRLEAMDYQNTLCEYDKYERALWGEGKPKQLYRRPL